MIISMWLFVVAGEEAKEEEGGMKPEILGNTPKEMRPGETQGEPPTLAFLSGPSFCQRGRL